MAGRNRVNQPAPIVSRTIERIAIAALAAIAARGEAQSVAFTAITVFIIVVVIEELGVVGLGVVKRRLFEMWLSQLLENCEFGALGVKAAIRAAEKDLGFDAESARRYLAIVTNDQGKFKVEDTIVTER